MYMTNRENKHIQFFQFSMMVMEKAFWDQFIIGGSREQKA